jgi:hypothetical protein
MIDFTSLQGVTIPEGEVSSITVNGTVLWNPVKFRYVSLGDSIAAGHMITDSWERDYGGEGAQYGKNGNTQTYIIPNSYTDLIRRNLIQQYGAGNVLAKSFARTGDMVGDLINKLSHTGVRDAIAKADIVTICIGANEVLQPAMSQFGDYVANGKQALVSLGNTVQSGLNNLASQSETSYRALFNKLYSLNSNATYVFTRIYNPYKYLWIEESTEANNYKDGFFGPLMWCIPDFVGDYIANSVRGAILQTSAVRTLFDRVNAIPAWAETYITKLNDVLDKAITDFKAVYPNAKFSITDTKRTFESFPDRNISASKHYNDLVNVEFTRGYVIENMDWGQFWSNVDWGSILTNIESVASDIVNNIVNNVILPDIDPHPETYGHEVLYHAFADALGWQSLNRYTITFNANGGSGSMAKQEVVGIGSSVYTILKPNAFSITTGYHFAGWKDQYGNSYSNGQGIFITSDLTLTAQWALNYYTVTYTHKMGDTIQKGDHHTGPMEYYELWVSGTDNNKAGKAEDKLGAFSNGPVYYKSLPHGTPIGVVVRVKLGSDRSYIDLNNKNVAGPAQSATYDFVLTSNVTIEFEWNEWLDRNNWFAKQDYWICNITTN